MNEDLARHITKVLRRSPSRIAIDDFLRCFAGVLGFKSICWSSPPGRGDAAARRMIASRATLVFPRWQLRFIGRDVEIDDLATEWGLAVYHRADVALLITSGTYSPGAFALRRTLLDSSRLRIILVDRSDLSLVKRSALDVVGLLLSQDELTLDARGGARSAQ